MTPLEWTPTLSVGHDSIDGQHRELFDRAGQFFVAASSGSRDREPNLTRAFLYLDSYVRFHFAQEEALMSRLGYPGLAEHREEHRDYIRRLDAVKSQYESEGDSASVVAAVDGLLRLWLVEHIGTSDRRVGAFAASRGD
ncbi:MAG TPA: bacteriohemerythrin [Anaeromyxobacteraceae bacterium]|nr:bacteriohemerythrin [Anaeromyxobacteraceae bacterium]